MYIQNLAVLLSISGIYASPIVQRDQCSDACSVAYNNCRSQPQANMATCAAQYSSCLGYVPFKDGSLVTPTACSTTAAATPTPTSDACVDKCNAAYNTCRGQPDSNKSYCAAQYSDCLGYAPFKDGSLVTPTACSAKPTVTPTPTATTEDACAKQCYAAYNTCRGQPDSNKSYCAAQYSNCLGYVPFKDGSLVTPTACSVTPTSTPTASPPVAKSETWTVKQLTRYCGESGSGCDYNFAISTNDGRPDERCTVIRMDVGDALTESWYNIPCTTGSSYRISWGYSTQFDVPFAVLTAVDLKKNAQAYFGVSNPNGKEVTPSNPKGSGNFGDIGPQPVYYN